MSWTAAVDSCPRCTFALNRHGWLAAVWINTWVTIGLVMAWIVGGLVVTAGEGPLWVTGGGVAIAIIVPPLFHRYAKGAMLRLLFKLDPPTTPSRAAE